MTEEGSAGFADKEETVIEKKREVVYKPKADMRGFDYEAFLLKQGFKGEESPIEP